MDILHIKKCNCNVRDYFLFVSNAGDDSKINVNYISMDCKCVRAKYEFDISEIDDYRKIKDVIETFEGGEGKLKGAIFDLFKIQPFKKRYEFCHFWKTFCNRILIPYQFINSSTLLITSILLSAKIDTVCNYLLTLVHCSKNEIQIFTLEPDWKDYFYSFVLKEKTILDANCSDKVFKDAVMKFDSPKVILSFDDPSTNRKFRDKSKKVLSLTDHYSTFTLQSLKIITDELFDISKVPIPGGRSRMWYRKYFVKSITILPYYENDLFITKQQSFGKCYGSFEMRCFKCTILPHSDTIDAYVQIKENIGVNIWNGETFETMETFDVSKHKNSHACLTLSVDVNGFYNLTIEKSETIPSTVASFTRKPDAFISLNDDEISISVPEICYRLALPPFISFFNENLSVLVGEDAKALAAKYPSFVIYDIFLLTKMSSNPNIKINPKWGFKVEKDLNGILQIHFDTCRGKRNEIPQFLVALLINYLLKSAKECIGFQPKSVQIQLDNNFRWIVNGVIEALKILDDKYDIKSEWTEKLVKVEML